MDGLADRSRANTRPVRKVDLTTKREIKRLQENPELGAWRVHAALKQLGIHVSPATCGRIMAENRRLYGLGTPPHTPKEPKEHPYKAQYRHHIWSVDVRYIEQHQIKTIKGPLYIISILDNFSRAILASNVCQRQDETAYLLVLLAAILQHGSPTILVSDSGAIFKTKQALQIYELLEIRKEQIHKRQSWENLLEANFNIQRRLADYHFAQVTSWEEARRVHEDWMTAHNEQPHWAHRHREDGRHSPAEVLNHEQGKLWPRERLHRVFFTRRFERALDRLGYVRFRNYLLYGEEGLARKSAMLWLYGRTLTVEFANTPLTQYTVSFQPDKKRFRTVSLLHRFETQYRSPQLSLWSPAEVIWLPALRLPEYAPRKRPADNKARVFQLVLFT